MKYHMIVLGLALSALLCTSCVTAQGDVPVENVIQKENVAQANDESKEDKIDPRVLEELKTAGKSMINLTAMPSCVVSVDGEDGTSSVSVSVDPGMHQVSVHCPTLDISRTKMLELNRGELFRASYEFDRDSLKVMNGMHAPKGGGVAWVNSEVQKKQVGDSRDVWLSPCRNKGGNKKPDMKAFVDGKEVDIKSCSIKVNGLGKHVIRLASGSGDDVMAVERVMNITDENLDLIKLYYNFDASDNISNDWKNVTKKYKKELKKMEESRPLDTSIELPF